MYLVGLGVDSRTERMVRFLAEKSNVDISLLTFHGFTYDDKTILAKRVEVDGATAFGRKPKSPIPSREERLKRLLERAESFGVGEVFSDIRDLFLANWNGVSERVMESSSYMIAFGIAASSRKMAECGYSSIHGQSDCARMTSNLPRQTFSTSHITMTISTETGLIS